MEEPKKSEKVWKNAIVGHAEVDPKTLVPNPENWRIHNEFQQKAMDDVLNEVGWIQNVIVNKATGRIVDGHLRVSLALERGEKTVPVTFVELTDEQERKALLTLDPMSELAGGDIGLFTNLADETDTDSLWIRELLGRTAAKLGAAGEEEEDENAEDSDGKEIPEMECSPFEHYDYIVVMFKNDQDFSGACEKLGIKQASMPLPKGDKVKVGMGRVLDGGKFLEKLDANRNSK